MKIGLIGSGKMAQAMGGYLKDHGYPVCGVWSRHHEKAEAAARFLGTTAHHHPAELAGEANILLVAVSDDAVRAVSEMLADSVEDLNGKWIGHLSGSQSLDVLAAVTARGAKGFSLHPLQTVPDPSKGRRDLAHATFMLEAEPEDHKSLESWLAPCGNPVGWIAPGRKALYHLGACLASNYVMTLYHLAEEALITSGISAGTASEALLPLMESTLQNYRSTGASTALTGPVSRGDDGTVRKHLESLAAPGWQHREALIRALGLEALALAQKSGRLDAESVRRMKETLNGGIVE